MNIAVAEAETKHLPGRSRLWPAILIISGCAAAVALAEMGAVAISNISRIERRTTDEIRAAIQMDGRAAHGNRRVLLVGNSLLLEGVNLPALQNGLQPTIETRRVIVESTFYLDWYYGLRKLLAAGSRPDLIVLSLSPKQFVAGGIRGDYSATRLIDAGDLLSVARDAALTPTDAASLWFAHFSKFYGMRQEIHKVVLWRVMPGVQELMPHFRLLNQTPASSTEIQRVAPPRLEALRKLADQYGARFLLLMPATLSVTETPALVEVGRQVGVPVIEPVAPGALPRSKFSDGFHLNEAGAEIYTAALVPVLKRAAQAQTVASSATPATK